jgi:choloylglycine hydrolase
VEPVFINLHYLISDKQGNVAVIEFYNSKLYFYEGEEIEYLVLSNNHYENSIKYIKNFQGFGGNLSIPKTNTSNDRFVKTALLLNKLEDHEKLSKVDYAFQILDSVKQDDTQWSIVYNNDKLTIHFLADGVNRKKIELKDFDFSCNTPIVCYPIKSADIGNISKHFIKYSPEINKELLFTVYKKYKDFQLGSASKDVFMEFHNYSESIKCKY